VVPPFPPDDERVAAVREALPAVGAGIYLDTATAGPLPSETAAAMAEQAGWELRTGRASPAFLEGTEARLDEARAAVAAVLTADVDEIAMTTSATAAMAAAAASIDWRPGDELLVAGPEHGPALAPFASLARTLGLRLVRLPLGDEDATLGELDRAMGPRTRLVAIPHVSAATGALLPIRRIADLARGRGSLVAVDGAHAAGAIPVDVPSLGVDFYAVAGEKWLLGPEGTGALWVGGVADARELDAGGWYRPAILGLGRSVGWLSMYVGLEWLHGRGTMLAAALGARLAAIPGVETLAPPGCLAAIVAFRIAGWPATAALEELGARTFLIARAIPERDAIRLSVGGFNRADELERLVDAVELVAAHAPGTLPARRTLTILGEDAR
jgi:L-cysteine/cystine lyase